MRPPPSWLPDDLPLLDRRCPLPLDRPFTSAEAGVLGVSRWFLKVLVDRGLIREVVRGAYVAVQVPDSIEIKAAALRLVVTDSAIVTDRTAAWFHGVDALPRKAAHEPIPLDVFSCEESRLRRPGVASGIRTLLESDIMVIGGVRLTVPLRTALDLGRILARYDAIGVLDGFLRIGVSQDDLLASMERFKGYRGVIQLRELAPFADPRPESPPESALRLHGHDAGLPELEPQLWVCDEWGNEVYRLDLALPVLRYGAEYHGERFHMGEPNEAQDAGRADWLDGRGWELDGFWKHDVYGPTSNPGAKLREGIMRARARSGAWRPQGKFLP